MDPIAKIASKTGSTGFWVIVLAMIFVMLYLVGQQVAERRAKAAPCYRLDNGGVYCPPAEGGR